MKYQGLGGFLLANGEFGCEAGNCSSMAHKIGQRANHFSPVSSALRSRMYFSSSLNLRKDEDNVKSRRIPHHNCPFSWITIVAENGEAGSL